VRAALQEVRQIDAQALSNVLRSFDYAPRPWRESGPVSLFAVLPCPTGGSPSGLNSSTQDDLTLEQDQTPVEVPPAFKPADEQWQECVDHQGQAPAYVQLCGSRPNRSDPCEALMKGRLWRHPSGRVFEVGDQLQCPLRYPGRLTSYRPGVSYALRTRREPMSKAF